MPLAYSNLVNQPANTALNNKLNPSPYQSLQPKPLNLASLGHVAPKPKGSVSGTNLNSAVANLNKKTTAVVNNPLKVQTAQANTLPATQNASVKTTTQAPLDSDTYKNLLMTNIQSQITDKQNQLKVQQDKEAQEAKLASETPKPAVGGMFGSLVGKGQENLAEAAKVGGEAGKLRQLIDTTKQNIMGNRNYAGSVKIGQAGLIDQNLGTQLSGLAAEQEALSGVGQSYLSAAGQVAPQQVSYSNQFLDPTTGEPINPESAGSLNDAVALQVQKLKSGATDPASARAALSAYGQAGINALEQSLGPGFNPNISSANQGSAADLTGQANQLQSIFNGVDANFKLLVDTAKLGGVNQNDVPILNAIQQNVQRGLASKEAVINFRNTLAAVRAGYAQILGGGTTTVDSQNRAEQAIPENISLGALQSLGVQLEKEAKNRIEGITQQINSLIGGGQNNDPLGIRGQ